MKVRFILFLLVCILASCQRNADIESVELPASKEARTALPKISKDIESLSVSDAVKVADIFTNGGVLTKSGAQKNVKSVVPVKGSAGEPLMYAVNYDDGYTIVSATKKYHPVLVSVDHGSYTGEPTGTGQDVLIQEYIAGINAALAGADMLNGNPWSIYEDTGIRPSPMTKVSMEYYDLLEELEIEWRQAGYNIYKLNQQPENMPDNVYETFCDMAMDYNRSDHPYMECSVILEKYYQHRVDAGTIMPTSWGQEGSYNDGLTSERPLGCTTVAIGQIMKALEHPTHINWAAMPNTLALWESNTALTNFLAQLRGHIGVDNSGGATINEVKNAISSHYGYNRANGYSLSIENHNQSSVCTSLSRNIPVFMGGVNANSGTGHAWVCDSYYATNYQTDYHLYVIPMGMGEITEMISPYSTIVYPEDLQIFLYYHMNFGWEGASDGYYFRDNVGAYSANRKNLIISRL